MFGRATVATASLILYSSLAAWVLGGVASTQRQVGIENIIRNRANYVVIAIGEGSETVVDGKRISTGMG